MARKPGTHRRTDCGRDAPSGCSIPIIGLRRDAAPDGSAVEAGALLATVAGPARAILTGERVALNFLGHLSGVATATAALVEAVTGHQGAHRLHPQDDCRACALLQKYAVRCGGGFNHRFGLDDAVLIKDNHIAAAGGIAPALAARARRPGPHGQDRGRSGYARQLEEALALGVDTILLDNMSPGRTAPARWRWPRAARCWKPPATSRCDTRARHCRNRRGLHQLGRDHPQRAQSGYRAGFLNRAQLSRRVQSAAIEDVVADLGGLLQGRRPVGGDRNGVVVGGAARWNSCARPGR